MLRQLNAWHGASNARTKRLKSKELSYVYIYYCMIWVSTYQIDMTWYDSDILHIYAHICAHIYIYIHINIYIYICTYIYIYINIYICTYIYIYIHNYIYIHVCMYRYMIHVISHHIMPFHSLCISPWLWVKTMSCLPHHRGLALGVFLGTSHRTTNVGPPLDSSVVLCL